VARVRWNTATLPSYVSSMWSNTEDWQYIRKAPELVSLFNQIGGMWVDDLNSELRQAQAARKQKIEDGYKFAINSDSDRIRMRIWAFTARAAAHEAKHQSILKLMKTSGWDVKRGSARPTNPGPNFGSGRRRRRGSTGNGRSRPPGGGGGSRRGPKSENALVNQRRNEARLRRRLIGLDALAHPRSGATEDERSLAAEKARRIRSRLGE
jgi:hypothetical protein